MRPVPSTADWLEAWSTFGTFVAAVVAGVFAYLAWRATRHSLDTAQTQLRLEMDRQVEERQHAYERSFLVASLLEVHLIQVIGGGGGATEKTTVDVMNSSAQTMGSLRMHLFIDPQDDEPVVTEEHAGLRPTRRWHIVKPVLASAWSLSYIDVAGNVWRLTQANPVMPERVIMSADEAKLWAAARTPTEP